MNNDSLYAAILSALPYAAAKEALVRLKDYSVKETAVHFSAAKTVRHIASLYGDDLSGAAEKILERTRRINGRILSFHDDEYPQMLREIAFAPLALYVKGNILKNESIAIVGTRNSTDESDRAASSLAAEIGAAGFIIVSGMAVGVDRQAHLGALSCGLPTVAVLANGLDVLYPKNNSDIFANIVRSTHSSLVSEYPPGVRGDKWTFVRRNRIISGMSRAVVVVKAAQKSGAMITARYALEQNRELFVCPGHAFDDSYGGCNLLIREGAVLVRDAGDILDELGVKQRINVKEIRHLGPKIETCASKIISGHMSAEEMRTYEVIGMRETIEVDELARVLDVDAASVNRMVTMLEVEGVIQRQGNLVIKA